MPEYSRYIRIFFIYLALSSVVSRITLLMHGNSGVGEKVQLCRSEVLLFRKLYNPKLRAFPLDLAS